jgi:hypothetical protein
MSPSGREVASFRTDVLPPAAKLQRGVMARKATVEVQVASECFRLSRVFVAKVYCGGRHVYIGFTSSISPVDTASLTWKHRQNGLSRTVLSARRRIHLSLQSVVI